MAGSSVGLVISLVAGCIGIAQGLATALLDSNKWKDFAVTVCIALVVLGLGYLVYRGARLTWLASVLCGVLVLANAGLALGISAPWEQRSDEPKKISDGTPPNTEPTGEETCFSFCPAPSTTEPSTTTTITTTSTTETSSSEPPATSTGPIPMFLQDAYINSNAVNTHAPMTIKGKDYPNSLTIGCVYRDKYPAVFNATGYSKITAMIGVADTNGEAAVTQDIPCVVSLKNEAGEIIWKDTFSPSRPRAVEIPLKGAGRITFECALTEPRKGYNSGYYQLGFGDALLS